MYFIDMELGSSSPEDLICGRDNGYPETEDVLYIMLQVTAGISFIHQRGIIHRDIKPANSNVLKTDYQSSVHPR